MIPAAFDYARASSVEEASKLLDKFGEDAKVLAGGHSLIPLMRLRLAQPTALVDINGIKDLDHTITPSPTNSLGVKGIGEAGTIAASAAVINAICDALSPLGIKHVDMPATPDKLWHMMKGARK